MDLPFFGSPPKHIGLRKKSSSSRKSILLWKREQLGQIRLNEMWSKFHSALLYSVSLTDFWQLRPHFRSFKMCGRFEENQTRVIIWSCLRRSQQSSFDWFQRQQFLLRLIAVAEAAGKSLWIKAAAKITLMLKKKKKKKEPTAARFWWRWPPLLSAEVRFPAAAGLWSPDEMGLDALYPTHWHIIPPPSILTLLLSTFFFLLLSLPIKPFLPSAL